MKLKTKLTVGSILLAVVPVWIAGSIITWQANQEARLALAEQAKRQLISIREMKKNQIEAYSQTIRDQVLTFSNDRMVIEAMNLNSSITPFQKPNKAEASQEAAGFSVWH
jgi:methyl-accepting chemotaxis protein